MHNDRVEEFRRDEHALRSELELQGAEFKGESCRCPFHDDRNPSAGIFLAKDGVWRFKCNGGSCGVTGDVFEMRAKREGKDWKTVVQEFKGDDAPLPAVPKPAAKTPPKIYASIEDAVADYSRWTRVEDTYPYSNPVTGKPDVWIIRHYPHATPESKKFAQLIPHGTDGAFIAEGPAQPWPIFNRRRIATTDEVYVVEGEKCVKVLAERTGIVATTGMGGASAHKAEKCDWTPLSGKRVWLWPDNDKAGRDYIADVERILLALPTPPEEIHVIDPAGMGLKEKGDVADLLADMEGGREELAAFVRELVGMNSEARGVLAAFDDHLRKIRDGQIRPVYFLKPRLSKLTNALIPETITMLVGDPGATKSFFLLNCALDWHERGVPFSIFEIEDSHAMHMNRLLAIIAEDGRMTDFEWMEKNNGEVAYHRNAHAATLSAVGKRIKTIELVKGAGKTQGIKLDELAKWTEERAAAGDRVIVLDPVTLAGKSGNTWEADLAFLSQIKATAEKHKTSIIVVSHPKQNKRQGIPVLDDIAGGAAWGRFCHTIIWLEYFREPMDSMIRRNPDDMPIPITHNRAMYLMKVRNGRGHGNRLAWEFEGRTLSFTELGVIEPEIKKKRKGGAT